MRWNCLAMIVWLATWPAMGAEPGATPPAASALSQEEVAQGFASIFDGKTLDGWRGSTNGYVPENGLLVCKKEGGGNLFTVKEFGDFVFRFDFKFEPGGNNGVSVRGHEIQILDDSTDRTVEIAKSFGAKVFVEAIHELGLTAGVALNINVDHDLPHAGELSLLLGASGLPGVEI